ncbi:MAG: HAD-IA family hydrolase [Clostridia bacterium]|nr:HAD-IA family hydrolase [Clostridia bacterium]
MIKTVLLDIDNTLLDFNQSAKLTMQKAFDELGLQYRDEVFETFLRVNDILWKKIERREMTRQELHAVRWWTVFGELGLNADGDKMERLFLDNLQDFAVPIDGALDLVKYLSGKYAVFTASNAPYAQQVKRLTISGIKPYVKGILNFEAIGVHKPQPQFFEECLKALSPAKKEEIALIGDSLSADMEGGKSVGFTTIWFNYAGSDTAATDICDYVVNSLSEITNIL